MRRRRRRGQRRSRAHGGRLRAYFRSSSRFPRNRFGGASTLCAFAQSDVALARSGQARACGERIGIIRAVSGKSLLQFGPPHPVPLPERRGKMPRNVVGEAGVGVGSAEASIRKALLHWLTCIRRLIHSQEQNGIESLPQIKRQVDKAVQTY
jgi:hypothetical protein